METSNIKSDSRPLVSILVPVYGVENFIKNCAVSVFEQSYANLEIIFIDDKTPDKSISIIYSLLQSYPHRKSQTFIINHKENRGLSSARNTGVDNAHGKYILHVDGDDYIEGETVSRLINATEKEDFDIVFFGMRHVYPNRTIVEPITLPNDKNAIIANVLEYKARGNVCGKLIKTTLYRQNNIRALDGISFGEDYAVSPQLLYYAERIGCVNEPLYNYVHTNNSSLSERYNSKNIDDLKKVVNYHCDFFKSKIGFEEVIPRLLAANLIQLLISCSVHPYEIGHRRDEIINMWSEYKIDFSSISLPYRLLWHIRKASPQILYLYVRSALKIKAIIKRIISSRLK